MEKSSSVLPALAGALRERITIIRDHALRERDPQGQLEQLQRVSGQIVSLQAMLPAPVDPRLAHYLERCSYDKALEWIEERLK